MKAMVLAAGLGTRLRPITYDVPKPLVPVLDRPVMEHALRLLKKHGFGSVVSNIHYFPDLMRDYFGGGSRFGVDLTLSFEEKLLGTAGGVRNVRDFLGNDPFVIISGDALTDIDLSGLAATHKSTGGVATLALKQVDDASEYGVVILNSDGQITGFQEKPKSGEELSKLANCGIYMFSPEIFDYFPDTDFVDWAQDVFPVLLEREAPFYGHVFDGYWNDVGSLEEYCQGSFDALNGAVKVDIPVPEVEKHIYAPADVDLSDAEIDGSVYIGEGCKLGAQIRLDGNVVIGACSKVGNGVALRDVVAGPGSVFADNSLAIEAVVGSRGRFAA